MTTPDKIKLAVEGLEIVAEAMRSVGTYVDIVAEAARSFVGEWQRFQEEVPHQTGQLSR